MAEKEIARDRVRKGAERRRHERHSLSEVPGRLHLARDMTVFDLSTTGMGIETSERLLLGGIYKIRLGEPEEELPIQARVVWCKLLATRSEVDGSIVPVYKAGLHFENADSEAVKGLGRYIQDQAAPGEKTQLEARIKLDKLARILIGDELEFMVTKISKGGMEAEMSHQPHIDSVLDLELSLGGEHVEVRGRVVNNANKNGGDECFIVGIEFLAPSDQAAQRLDAFISTLTAAGH